MPDVPELALVATSGAPGPTLPSAVRACLPLARARWPHIEEPDVCEVTEREVDAAAAVLWAKDPALRRDVPWGGASDDERAPYRHMARQMLQAAAAVGGRS